MDCRNQKNYKIALTHSKVTITSISPNLSHLKSTFFGLFSFSRSVDKTLQGTGNYSCSCFLYLVSGKSQALYLCHLRLPIQ